MEEEKDACGKVYSAGIYARLSVEGDERKNESIEAQIAIAEAFLETREDIELFDCYVDLGKSGTNFDREGFARLMQDVRDRKVDCVVVKDLSRFGRNHIEMGNYLERIFPFLGVRFIAVELKELVQRDVREGHFPQSEIRQAGNAGAGKLRRGRAAVWVPRRA